MRITKEQGMKIKKEIQSRGYSITGFCRIHNISDRQFYSWLAGTNGYERNGIGKHFQDVTDALFADKALDVATDTPMEAYIRRAKMNLSTRKGDTNV